MPDDATLDVRTEIVGFNGFIQDILRRVHAQAGRDILDLHQELVELMEDIKANYVPIDTGDLADSGYVSEPFLVGDTWTIAIGFGAGLEREYALIQHERLDYYHPHGQAKYLEEPLTAWASRKGADV